MRALPFAPSTFGAGASVRACPVARWAARHNAWWWLTILVASLNSLHVCRTASFRTPSAAQDRLLQRLREEVRQFIREAAQVRLGGEQFLREFVHPCRAPLFCRVM